MPLRPLSNCIHAVFTDNSIIVSCLRWALFVPPPNGCRDDHCLVDLDQVGRAQPGCSGGGTISARASSRCDDRGHGNVKPATAIEFFEQRKGGTGHAEVGQRGEQRGSRDVIDGGRVGGEGDFGGASPGPNIVGRTERTTAVAMPIKRRRSVQETAAEIVKKVNTSIADVSVIQL